MQVFNADYFVSDCSRLDINIYSANTLSKVTQSYETEL